MRAPGSTVLGISIKHALTHARQALSGTSPSPEPDARALLQHCLHREQAWLITHADSALSEAEERRYMDCIVRRQRGEPVAYITGCKEFWSLDLMVTRQVLIPRPETEHLVEHALRHIPAEASWRIADLGTGSGAVALAIAAERPGCEVLATDVSAEALNVGTANAEHLGVNNLRFELSDWFEQLTGRRFHMIVSNPPYIPDSDPCLIDLAFEPAAALRAGPDGLDALALIGTHAGHNLEPGGWLIVEHGCDQQEAVEKIFHDNGFEHIICHHDHAGLPRVTECRTKR